MSDIYSVYYANRGAAFPAPSSTGTWSDATVALWKLEDEIKFLVFRRVYYIRLVYVKYSLAPLGFCKNHLVDEKCFLQL